MSAPKPLFVLLFPAALGLALPVARAQEKTPATPTPSITSTGGKGAKSAATLTPSERPATSIAPRQSLPVFVSAKTGAQPVVTAPDQSGKTKGAPIAPAVPAQTSSNATTPPLKTAQIKTALPALSARERSTLATPAPIAPRGNALSSRRHVFAAGVSLATAPIAPVPPTPLASIAAPVFDSDKLASSKVAPQRAAGPSQLASREARARQLALARMDAQLAKAEGRLDVAQSRLTEGQRQLGSVTNLLQSAMLSTGGSGLHPFVRVAQRYLGTPYVWGGESARGFDCSGFIMRVMRDLGYKALPHSAAEQFNYGKPIAKNLLQPGDIVFFANTYKPGVSHVGIYLGGGRFIHAANSQVGTIMSNLNEQKWIDHYAGARRLMKMK